MPIVAIATYLVIINLKRIIRVFQVCRQKASTWRIFNDPLNQLVEAYYLALAWVLRRPRISPEDSASLEILDSQEESKPQEDVDLGEGSNPPENSNTQAAPATQDEKPARWQLGKIIQRAMFWKQTLSA